MNKETILCPNCSETVEHLGIKEEEMPYIMKRIKDLGLGDDKDFIAHFKDLVGQPDGSGDGWISEGDADTYNKIKEELLAKRGKICPFCKEEKEDISKHVKEEHFEELKIALKNINKEEYSQIRREIILDNL